MTRPAAAPRPGWPVPVRERATSAGPGGSGASGSGPGGSGTGASSTGGSSTGAARPVWPNAAPARRVTAAPPAPAPDRTEPAGTGAAAQPAAGPAEPVTASPAAAAVQPAPVQRPADTASLPAPATRPAPPPRRPVVRVTADAASTRPLNVVERALRTPPGAAGPRDPVVVVPGGHRPGKPDQVQRDQARVRLALSAPARIVVLGCTGGAGQTVTTLLTGQLLASLRDEPVAVLDLATGQGTLTEQARLIPVLLPRKRISGEPGPLAGGSERGLQVVTARDSSEDPDQIISAVAARYPLTLADPDAGRVPRTLRAADQLILVAPATAEAAGVAGDDAGVAGGARARRARHRRDHGAERRQPGHSRARGPGRGRGPRPVPRDRAGALGRARARPAGPSAPAPSTRTRRWPACW